MPAFTPILACHGGLEMNLSSGAYAVLLALLLAWPTAGFFMLLNSVFISIAMLKHTKFAIWNTAFLLLCILLALFLFWSSISNLGGVWNLKSKALAGLLEFLVFAIPAMVICHSAFLICCWAKLRKQMKS